MTGGEIDGLGSRNLWPSPHRKSATILYTHWAQIGESYEEEQSWVFNRKDDDRRGKTQGSAGSGHQMTAYKPLLMSRLGCLFERIRAG